MGFIGYPMILFLAVSAIFRTGRFAIIATLLYFFQERANAIVKKYAEKYTFDPKVQEWLRDVNPWALQRMAEVLLEAEQRGLWNAKPETKSELQKLYLSIEGEIEERSDANS